MTITYEEVAKRAFEIWKDEGEIEGREQDHWLRAESELRKERSKEQKGKQSMSKNSPMQKTPR